MTNMFDNISSDYCPFCADKKTKTIIHDLLMQGISYDSIAKYFYDRFGAIFSVADIKYHKENHFNIKEERAFSHLDRQRETQDLLEKYWTGQQKSIELIDTLNLGLEQMIKRLEDLLTARKGEAVDKRIIGYMKEIRMTTESIAKMKGEFSDNITINSHIVRDETNKIVQIISEILEEVSPDKKDQFLLRLAEKLSEE